MNVFKQLFRSSYSPKDIAVFRFQGIGKTILYVFLLTLISTIPSIYYLGTTITNVVGQAKDIVNREFPSFTIENGQLNSSLKEPITINQNGFAIFFDSTGKANKEDLENLDNGIAFLKNELVFVAGGQNQAYSYSMTEDLMLTKNDLLNLIDSLDSSLIIFLPILFLVIYIFSSGVTFAEISVLALFGLLIRNLMRRKLKYGQLWRMSAYSVTLPTLFFTFMEAIKTNVQGGFLLHWFVASIILFLAIKEIKQINS